ncbi:MAG: hypothetical protein UR68_C0012G0020 [Candidatus Roizmanbacteria bacterium GW2011_GWA2_35_19]|uniref:Uncharacterized protein n=2 Tax=Candidatus Roizmaniibacteriota TaxID=1752723 RepID=A0A0G0F089_9BACT|nr:MAG: hypothetical protein UR63_C0024G0009 [Candidatus Roizmanbacteria bacterium GW2011_GWC2_35_12]KKP72827.1 MAG: hypothetical protein UR68_C0012G0020 [Candidatus Roizmanbacteria bacterium GW2011_GWA2_35_19]
MKNLNDTLNKVIKILTSNNNLDFDNCLVKMTSSHIVTPIGDIASVLEDQKSKLKDELVDFKLFKDLVMILNTNNSIVRLNHIGFGYRVKSQQFEKQRLINLAIKTNQFLYEEESNDFALWLFLGDTTNWEKPLIEFVPVEQDHLEIDYFLPHIQIDIDTTLNANEIESITEEVFNTSIKPYRVAVINGITYIVRNRLGVIDGVNIFIDLATNSRNVKFHRQNYLKKIT